VACRPNCETGGYGAVGHRRYRRRMPRTPSLAKLPAASLRAELVRRERQRDRLLVTLRRRHAKAMKAVAGLEEQMRALGGSSRGRTPTGRARNAVPLVEALARVLKGKAMSVAEAAEAVIKSGYQSGAANFRLIVNQTVLKRKDLFKRVGRGRYRGK
jgi:hypothetical protein